MSAGLPRRAPAPAAAAVAPPPAPRAPTALADGALSLLLCYALEVAVVFRTQGFFSWSGVAMLAGTLALVVWQALSPIPVWARLGRPLPRLRREAAPILLVSFLVLGCLRPIAPDVRSFAWNLGGWAAFALAIPFACGYFPGGSWPARLSARLLRGWLAPLRHHRFAVLVALSLAARLYTLVASPSPVIDVWSTMQDGADALARGANPYAVSMSNPYHDGNVIDYYGYPPLVLLVTAPFRWVCGDVRVALIAAEGIGAMLLFRLAAEGGARRSFAELAACLLLFHPRALHVLERSWTEPISAALFLGMLLALRRRSLPGTAVLVALFLVSKQYLLLGAPVALLGLVVLAGTPGRALAALGVALATGALAVLPVALWDLQAFVDDVVWFHVRRVPISPGSLSLSSLALRTWGVRLPALVSGVFAAGALALGLLVARRELASRGSLAAAVASATAVTFVVALPFQKQAFCNYYHLAGTMLLAAVVLAQPAEASAR